MAGGRVPEILWRVSHVEVTPCPCKLLNRDSVDCVGVCALRLRGRVNHWRHAKETAGVVHTAAVSVAGS
jgi:hypothetical protein